MIAGTVYAEHVARRYTMQGGRKCAKCGKDMGQGQAPMAASLLVKWSKELGICLVAPESRYLDPRCARSLQEAMRRKESK